MVNLKDSYTEFHKKNKSNHLYPTEWVIRTMLGNYPELKLDRSKYQGGKILDLGFGDGRNFSLLNNCGLEIYGVEISQTTLDLANHALTQYDVNATLKVGSNTNLPFENDFFDYILACASCYYIDEGDTFYDNIKEISRVLKPGGYLIANLPVFTEIKEIPVSFILDKAEPTDDGHVIIKNDVFGLRNGYKFKAFSSEKEIRDVFSDFYEDIAVGNFYDNYYGLQLNLFSVVGKKK